MNTAEILHNIGEQYRLVWKDEYYNINFNDIYPNLMILAYETFTRILVQMIKKQIKPYDLISFVGLCRGLVMIFNRHIEHMEENIYMKDGTNKEEGKRLLYSTLIGFLNYEKAIFYEKKILHNGVYMFSDASAISFESFDKLYKFTQDIIFEGYVTAKDKLIK